MLFARKLLISSTPSLLKVRRKVPKPGIFTVCPCWSCWGTNLARSSSEASISMGAVVVLAVAAHIIALPESGVSLLGVAYHLPGSCLFCGFTFLINLYFAILFCFKLLIM